MQKILTLKYLGFSFKEIIEYLSKNSTNSVHDTLYKHGAPPYTLEVQHIITQLDAILSKIIEPKYQEEIEKLEIEDSSLYYFSFMSKGFQDYIGEATRILNEENNVTKTED